MSTIRQCPNCNVTLTRYEWSKLWWMSSIMSGRLVQPCKECGALMRFSALTLLTGVGALGLIVTAALLFKFPSIWLRLIALAFAVIILVGVMGTRLETVPAQSVEPTGKGKVDEI
ncbi:MAG TPA: hypothetical protein VLT86_13350 [Vicinamibacterales bacterium]|nr:hypothetical protein [Vicinamibacterales bacterium]